MFYYLSRYPDIVEGVPDDVISEKTARRAVETARRVVGAAKKLWRELLEKVREWAKELSMELQRLGIRVDEVILFGSYARGDFAEGSDLDLIIVSRDWGTMELTQRLSILYRLWDKNIDANFIPLTPEELRERIHKSIALRDASKYWITIYKSTKDKPPIKGTRAKT